MSPRRPRTSTRTRNATSVTEKALSPKAAGVKKTAKATGKPRGRPPGGTGPTGKRRSQSEAVKVRKRKESRLVQRAKKMDGEAEGEDEGEDPDRSPTPDIEPEMVTDEETKKDVAEWEVEKILDSRMKKVGRGSRRELLIKWVGFSDRHNTWEPEKNVENAHDLLSQFDADYPEKP